MTALDPAGARRMNQVAALVLPVVAAVGAVLSWGSLYTAASAGLGAHAPVVAGVNVVGAAFPLLVDALILGASARYVAGVKAGRPVAGWRLAAHAGVAGTVLLNADAAPTLGDVPWHVTAPIVWSVLVELVARDALGQLRAVQDRRPDRIPLRLWVTTPAESIRVSWRMARTGIPDATQVRADTERCAAAADLLAVAMPGARYAGARRQITRRLWSGALDPGGLARLIAAAPDPRRLHRTVLHAVAGAAPAGVEGEDQPAAVVEDQASTPPQTAVPGPVAGGPGDGLPPQSEAPERPARAPRATRRPQGKATASRASDADLVASLDAAVTAGQLAPAGVTKTAIRTRYGVGDDRARRIAEAWHERHRRTAVAAVTT